MIYKLYNLGLKTEYISIISFTLSVATTFQSFNTVSALSNESNSGTNGNSNSSLSANNSNGSGNSLGLSETEKVITVP